VPNLPLSLTSAALLVSSALLGAAVYDSVVLAPNLRRGPAGLEHGRLFLRAATPANLFRVLGPASQILLLAAIVVDWRNPQVRWPLAGAFLALILADGITFAYHYPRNRLMFEAPLTVETERLNRAARQWAIANFVRVALVLGCWLATLVALLRLAAAQRAGLPV
jgi:uncharacterized membrane protein